MAILVHKDGMEYGYGILIFAAVIVVLAGVIGAGAIAAVPAFFGAINAALWTWGILSGLWTGTTVLATIDYRRESVRVL